MQSEMVFNITEMVEQLSNNSYEDDEQEEKVVREMFQSEKDSELKSFFKVQFYPTHKKYTFIFI